ncbi:MAG: ParB/RepB/Spo0J family partition protein [Acidobacteriota bacterium]
MSKRGLPGAIAMRHDSHYVDELAKSSRSIGRTISISQIFPNPEQPRTEFGDLTDLSDSIKEKGVLEPLLVSPVKGEGTYMIIAGERRWRASQLAGLTEVPCIEMVLDEQGIAEIALIENLQRKDLTIWEEADGLKALAEKFNYTQEEIAKKISKSRTTVNELMTIAGLPDKVREICRTNKINAKAALLDVARQFDEAAMYEHLEQVTNGTKPASRTFKKSDPIKAEIDTSAGAGTAHKFSYSGDDRKFRLDIVFTKGADHSKRGVLEALKQAFENVKSDVSDV